MNRNLEIRQTIKKNLLENYLVAEKMGISCSSFYQWLQKPLTDDKEKKFFRAIDELLEERKRERSGTGV